MPPDPVRAAELTERDRLGAAAFAALLEAPPRAPAPPATPDRSRVLTARERGQERRRAMDAAAAQETPALTTGWSLHTTGIKGQHSTGSGLRGRMGVALGRVKKQRHAMRDV